MNYNLIKFKSPASLLPILIVLFFTVSCKKKEASPAPTPPVNNAPAVLAGDFGTFISAYTVTKYGNTLYTDSAINASFYDSPSVNYTYISAGTVSVNNTTLFVSQSPNPIVYSQTNGINMQNLNWQISGSGTISAASFSYTPVYPTYTAYNLLQDTVTKANGFNLNISGVTNSNSSIYLVLSQNGSSISKTLAATPGTITISNDDISNFNTSSDFSLRFTIFNYSHVTLNSKQYGISANRAFQKTIYLK